MLQVFEPLMGATWQVEGNWKDGKPFKQEVKYSWALNDQHVRMNTNSYLDTNFTSFGAFSEGMHSWDAGSNTLKFSIYDIYGNIIQGIVVTKEKTIQYIYDYTMKDGSVLTMTDALIWVKPDKYMFKVGTMEDGEWKETYLETYFFKK